MRVPLLLLLFPLSFARADSIERHVGDVNLTLSSSNLKEAKRTLPLSDLLRVRCKVAGKDPLEVEVGQLEVDPKMWNLTALPVTQPSERVWTLDPLQPGKLIVPGVTVRYRESADREWKTAAFTEIALEVVGPTNKVNPEVRGDLPLEPLPDSPSVKTTFPVVEVVIGAALVLLLGGLFLFVRRSRPKETLPPDQRALRKLERLSHSTAAAEQPGWLHARVSIVVRNYLDERFSLPAPRQTTEEVLTTIRASGQLGEDVLRDVEDLCNRCDQVKFAGLKPTAEEDTALVILARRIIEATSVKAVT